MESCNTLVYGDVAATIATAAPAFRCDACFKTFSTAGNLSRHLESSKVCRSWLETSKSSLIIGGPRTCDRFEAGGRVEDATNMIASMKVKRPCPPVLTGSFIYDKLSVSGSTCQACGKEFSTPGSLSRHYRTNVVCDRTRARDLLDTLKDSFQDMFTAREFPALQETGFDEIEALGPMDSAKAKVILDAPDTHVLPPPTIVGTPKTWVGVQTHADQDTMEGRGGHACPPTSS
jgi:Zinc finger, C2H2 type